MSRSDFELNWPASEAELVPRSRLIRLAPIGVGTARAESLTSYIVRLARAHSVSPRALIRTEFARVQPEIADELRPLFFRIAARTIDSLGLYAFHFSQAAGTLTRVGHLGCLTLLPLRHLLPQSGEGLLAWHPKWCPSCFAEMTMSGAGPFRPLTWSFKLYWYCSIHHHRLLDHCPVCGNAQHVIPDYPSVCHCSHCGSWLGSGAVQDDVASPVDEWIAAAIEDIVFHLPTVEASGNRDSFLRCLSSAVEETKAGSLQRFSKMMGLNPPTLRNWFRGIRPTFPQWLSVAYGLGVRPTQLLAEPGHIRIDQPRLYERPAELTLREKRQVSVDEHKLLGSLLSKVADDPEDKASLANVARRLGRHPATLKRLFSDACGRIQAKHVAAIQAQTWLRRSKDAQKVRDVVQYFIERGEYPSRGKVNRRLQKLGVVLVRPELGQIYRDAIAGLAGDGKPPMTEYLR